MKYLIYSKTFKKNLKKWFLMYLGVIGLLTVAVTYSRYITSNSMQDQARPARFEIAISDATCLDTTSKLCTLNDVRPTDYISYYFKVDTSKMEVDADIVLTFNINNNYERVEDFDFTEYVISKVDGDNRLELKKGNITRKQESVSTYFIKIEAESGKIKTYEVKLKYAKNSAEYYKNANHIAGVVSVGYSAIQVK